MNVALLALGFSIVGTGLGLLGAAGIPLIAASFVITLYLA